MTPPTDKSLKLDLSKVGTTGLPVWSGRVYDEVLHELSGEQGRKIVREMSEQDPIIGGILLGVELLSRGVTWAFKPADDTDKAREVAEHIEGCLYDLYPTWENTLSEILSFLTYGWSYLEIIYKRRQGLKPDNPRYSSKFTDGKIGWGGWSIRSQETLWGWDWTEDNQGEIAGMIQMAPPHFKMVTIPRNKSLHFTTRSRRENPEGYSLLRNCYRPWYMKKNIEVIEGVGVERDLAGLPVLWAPPNLFNANASEEEQALFKVLQNIVTSIKRDEQEGILMPMQYDEEGKNPLYKLELLSAGGDRQFDTSAIINRYDERIAMSMLADFILMGHQAVGSYALSTTKTGLFSAALSAFLDLIAAEINMQAIPRLVLLNGWSLDLVPTLQHGQIDTTDMSKLAAFIQALNKAGMQIFPNQALEKYLLQSAGLPSDPIPEYVDDQNIGSPDLDDVAALLSGQPSQQPLGLPAGQQVKPATTTPAVPNGQPVVPVAKPATRPRVAKPATKVAREPRAFTTLFSRVAGLRDRLMDQLSDQEYSELLDAAVVAGSFNKLPEQYREMIKQAEATE